MRLLAFIFVVIILQTSIQTYAQDWCNPNQRPGNVGTIAVGGFTIQGKKYGCIPFTANVTPTVGTNHKYIYDYTGGDPFSAVNVAKYDTSKARIYLSLPRAYRIMQIGSVGGVGSLFCDEIVIFGKPQFSLKACSGLRVQATIINDTIVRQYDALQVDWGDGTAPTRVARNLTNANTLVVEHTYTTNMLRNVSIAGIYQNDPITCQGNTQPIVPSGSNLNSVSIKRVTTRTDGAVDVLVQGGPNVTADLQMAIGNTTFMSTGQNVSRNDTATLTIRSIDPTKNTYCFRLATNDGCESAGGSSTVCSISLDAVAQNRQNSLQWNQYPIPDNFVTYRVTRNSMPIVGITSTVVTQYTDKAVNCGESYAYQVTAVLANGVEARSQFRQVTGISDETPSMVRNTVVSVGTDGLVNVTASLPLTGTSTNFKTVFLRADNGSNDFREVAVKDKTLTLKDADVQTSEKSYCYKIQYENNCGNRSEATPPACTILLSSKSPNTIDWTGQTPFNVPVTAYTVELLDDKNNLDDQPWRGNGTSFDTKDPNLGGNNQQQFRYRIWAVGLNGMGNSYSNIFVFKRPAQLFVPSAFTPNSDAVNSVFAAKGSFIDKFSMIIYNRLGIAIFESNDLKTGWDGTYNGQPVAEGVYVYKIDLIDAFGERYARAGTVTLVR
jgi:gliding motility-associated-like protein